MVAVRPQLSERMTVRGLFEAYDRDAWLPILLDGDGLVSEGAGSNVFAIVNGELLAPPAACWRGSLEGPHRDRPRPRMAVRIGDIPASALCRAQEIFLTSAAGGVMPVATLDGEPVGQGRPGPMTTALRDRYWELNQTRGTRSQSPLRSADAVRRPAPSPTVDKSTTPLSTAAIPSCWERPRRSPSTW